MLIVIPGDPIPKARARIFQRKKKSIAYDPQGDKKEYVRNKIKYELKIASQRNENNISNDFLEVDMEFHMPIPVSTSKTVKEKMKLGSYHNRKPDASNMYKFYEDCANGVLYQDDSQIVKGSFKKIYSENPRTIININSINV